MSLIHPLSARPVLGVGLGNVLLLRLDLIDGPAPGNKSFKLRETLAAARRQGVRRLVSFGGAWSNHLHALAAVGQAEGFATVGIVRGEAMPEPTAMLRDARRWGMQICHVSRSEYRRRHEVVYLEAVAAQFAPCLIVPEGGASADGARGCAAIAELIAGSATHCRRVVLAVGSGTTLAGVTAALDERYCVEGISALKGANDLEQNVANLLRDLSPPTTASWHIAHDFHCGGFARVDAGLREFMLAFERVQGVALDPVYTAKVLYAIYQQQRDGQWDAETPLLAIHTGGLQGRRGYSWLD